MSQFYGEVQGSRGRATRGGDKHSGIEGHIRGWRTGVRVRMFHEDGKDYVEIYETGGSTNPANMRKVGGWALDG